MGCKDRHEGDPIMTNSPDDDTVEFPAIDDGPEAPSVRAEAKGLPECGTEAAVTYLHITFNDASGVRFAEKRCCCFRHIPHPAEVLPEDAELIEIVLQDAWTRTVVRDGQVEITVSERFVSAQP
jgi:hypothetical protein